MTTTNFPKSGVTSPFFGPTGLPGATQSSRLVGATASGAPVTGTFAVGDVSFARNGSIWMCTSAGTPGTWVDTGTSGGAGTVTSVGLTAPAEFSVAGSPVTTSGTLAITKAVQNANKVWAGPATGADAQPAFRGLVVADIPAGLPYSSSTLTDAHMLIGNGSNVATDVAVSGDLTVANTGAFTIANNAVTNAKAAQMAPNTIKGNNTGGTANAADLTSTQTTAMLNAMVGDSGSGGTKGLAPSPASGDAAAGKFLKADGTWSVPADTTGITALTGQVTAGPGSGSQVATIETSVALAGSPTTTTPTAGDNSTKIPTTAFIVNGFAPLVSANLTGTISEIGTVNINNSGAGVTTIGTGGTGAVNIGNATGNIAVTGTLAVTGPITGTSSLVVGGRLGTTVGGLGVIGDSQVTGNFTLSAAGNGLLIAEGTDATMGIGTLNGSTEVTISTTKVTANSRIIYSFQAVGGTPLGVIYTSARVPGTSFGVKGAATDTSVFAWVILEPA